MNERYPQSDPGETPDSGPLVISAARSADLKKENTTGAVCPPQPSPEVGGPSAMLGIVHADAVDTWINGLRMVPEHTRPDRIGIISVDDVVRSAASARNPTPTQPISITTVADPLDIAQIGTAAQLYCEEWRREDARITVCVHALDALLEHVDRIRVVRFLAGLIDTLEGPDTDVHVHIDPGRHDPAAVSRVESLLTPPTEG